MKEKQKDNMETLQTHIQFIRETLIRQEKKFDDYIAKADERIEYMEKELGTVKTEVAVLNNRLSSSQVFQTVLTTIISTVAGVISLFWGGRKL